MARAGEGLRGNPALDVLLITLELAVPMRITELLRMTSTQRESVRMVWAKAAAQAIASQGDVLQYGSKKRGEAAKVFNRIAMGLAAAAFQPGGITFAGCQHWEVTADDLVAPAGPAPAGVPYPRRPVENLMESL